ncbi:hypothetical protein CASFOL_001717 [Castilleja foliolosa]|uniref:Uncharacterized protein n=1 Tax=Castilleja foliolosa TaxID=1961234 RepID=A0ABD3ECY5_9LAMI
MALPIPLLDFSLYIGRHVNRSGKHPSNEVHIAYW